MTSYFATTCPTCGYQMDAHATVGETEDVPEEGDYSVCLACGELSVYQVVLGSLHLRRPTHDERQEALDDDTMVAVMFAQRAARTMHEDEWPRGPKERT